MSRYRRKSDPQAPTLRAHVAPAWNGTGGSVADIIDLDERLKRRGVRPAYRVYRIGRKGREQPVRTIDAGTDAEAKAQVMALLDLQPVELWDRKRFIARYWPHKHPVAISIKVLADPSSDRT